jgi:SAM-dependent methyltransferase
MINRILTVYRRGGLDGIWRAVLWRWNLDILWRLKRKGPRRLSLQWLGGRKGIEIGGPSTVFSASGPVPVYPVIEALDNCNFSTSTVWQDEVVAGENTYRFADGRAAGKQYIGEASDLKGIPSSTYDFLICSHVIEHVANPLQALREWLRVIKPDGSLVIVAPHRDCAFDHRRPITNFQHLLEDFERGTGEDDLTHLPEILALHDLDRDPDAGSPSAFEARCLKNLENRCLHHHVFDMNLIARMLRHVGCDVLVVDQLAPQHIVAVARKPI